MLKESLGNKLADSDSRDFWKEIKGVNNAKMPLQHILRELRVKAISLACGGTTIVVCSTLLMGDATQLTFLNGMMPIDEDIGTGFTK